MKYVPVKNPDFSRVYKNELRLDALFQALGAENYQTLVEKANMIYQQTLEQVELLNSIVKLTIFSNGSIVESVIL